MGEEHRAAKHRGYGAPCLKITALNVKFTKTKGNDVNLSRIQIQMSAHGAGEARTDAFVQSNGGDDATFDCFAEPASLILVTLLKACVPANPARQALLRRSEALKLPNNPLVRGRGREGR